MAPNASKNAASATRVSPTQSVSAKRERSDDEETTRRVSQRTNEDEEEKAEDAAGATATMDELVLKGLLSNNVGILEETLKKINNFMCDMKDVNRLKKAQNDFFHLGAHTSVVRVMEKHLGCVPIQEWGISVLTNACCENICIEEAIARVEGMQAIVAAMKKHSKNANLIYDAIGALYNLTILEANAKMFVSKTDGVSLILKCMKTFSEDDEVVYEACRLFRNLCKCDQLRSKLVDASVGSSLMVAYESNTDDENIRKPVREAMQLLLKEVSQRTNEEEKAEDAAGAKDAMDELVLNGLLSNDEEVLKETLKKIHNLLYNEEEDEISEEARNDIFLLGGHLVVVRVMENHLGCAKIQYWGVCVLYNAGFDDSLEQAIVRVGGVHAILAAMKKHSKNEILIYRAIEALVNLTFHEANAELFVTDTDGVSLVLKCMQTFSGDEKVVNEACDLLHSLCKHDQLRSKLDDAKVGTSLMVAYDNNKDNEKIRKTVGKAMKLLLE